ncbi:YoaK family protein [Sinorhizobium sp. RAC02]|uniref:YoaK family protein n=1 Tax=Sinorhizobium sp. RAC02 TaxID=1842534 RepID=UPI001495F0AC|nr:YoaK family protein [Sinorhizobium sp. RAC02]
MLASILAFVAGGVNSAGYMAYHYFSANMTGNVSLASELLAVFRFDAALAFLTVVVMFIVGAFLASFLIEVGKRQRRSNIYALTLIVEATLLILIGLAAALSTQPLNGVLVVGLLSLTMGIQNAASTRISGSRVRTTHVSGVATDLGVGLAMLLGVGAGAEKSAIVLRLKLHLATIVFFALGGVLGVLGHQQLGGVSFCVFAMPLIILSVRYLR